MEDEKQRPIESESVERVREHIERLRHKKKLEVRTAKEKVQQELAKLREGVPPNA